MTQLHLIPRYIAALVGEIDRVAFRMRDKAYAVRSIYIGGGTPSLLSPDDLSTLLRVIRNSFSVDADIEIACEANPGTLSAEWLAGLRRTGVNRLTLGVQSFRDADLQRLGRIHDSNAACDSIRSARNAGFTNLGIDLIFAVPGQTRRAWQENLEQALSFQLEHLSLYGLTVEPATPLAASVDRGEIKLCPEELQREMMLDAMHLLPQAGYDHYELSNYARRGFASRHNCAYWQGMPYCGFGASAHSFDGKSRWWNSPDVEGYCLAIESGRAATAEHEDLTGEQALLEMILLGLRLKTGIDSHRWHVATDSDLFEFARKGKLTIAEQAPAFSPSGDGRLLTHIDQSLCLTEEGVLLYDAVCEKLAAGVQLRADAERTH